MRHLALKTVIICLVAFGSAAVQAQQPTAAPAPPPAPPFGTPVTLPQAIKIADAAMTEARKINVMMAVTITEPTGDLVYFAKMDGAPYSAIQLAQAKAWTAARFRRPTQAFNDQLAAGNSFFLTFGINAAPGGVMIVHDGKLIGALGISGGSGGQDTQVATAGLAALK